MHTEERYSPGFFDLCTGYEHIHRYLFALQYTRGKKVLDLACGEGYGSALIARSACEVIGMDICADTIHRARGLYSHPNLVFTIGSMESIPLQDTFDVIICFEAIEHIENHDLLCKEVKRLLKQEGIFILSTPNKWVYSENGKTNNPYHLKELDLNELQALLAHYFSYQYLYGQKTVTASRIFSLHASHLVCEERILMDEHAFCQTGEEEPLPRYFIALASEQHLQAYEGVSYLTDVAPRNGYAQWLVPQKHLSVTKRACKKLLKLLHSMKKRCVRCLKINAFW